MSVNFSKGGRIGKPLFVGTRYFVLKRRNEEGKDEFVFEDAIVSLVGHDGLVIEKRRSRGSDLLQLSR